MKNRENVHDIATSINRLQRELPGWWWTISACNQESSAGVGPCRGEVDEGLLQWKEFDDGFNIDLKQQGRCAQALNSAIDLGIKAKNNAII